MSSRTMLDDVVLRKKVEKWTQMKNTRQGHERGVRALHSFRLLVSTGYFKSGVTFIEVVCTERWMTRPMCSSLHD